MSQTSLNLTAIVIFSLVMSVMLGPLIHLPPAVPALAAFSILGLATLDTLSWQGQGGTLLLDWLTRRSPAYRDRILHHEAGHFLVAYLLNLPITGYTLNAWEAFRQQQPGQGGVTVATTELDAELLTGQLSARLIDQYCTVWMAGIAAETLVYGDAQGGSDDRRTLNALFAQLRQSPADADLKQRWALLQAKTLLEQYAAAYTALVTAMEQRASVDDCCRAIATGLEEVASEG